MHSSYATLRRKVVLIMAAAALLPALLLALLNYNEFKTSYAREEQNPIQAVVSKSKSALELFLAERSSTVSFIASAFSYEDLADPRTLQRIFAVMQKEFSGFVDIGLINSQGKLVNYVGPHQELAGADYSGQEWFHKVSVQNRYVSEVFPGLRNFPHMIAASRHTSESGEQWIVRATIDSAQFSKFITAMNLTPDSSVVLVSRAGILQIDSSEYGKALAKFPLPMPQISYETRVIETKDTKGRPITIAYSYLPDSDYVVMAIKPETNFMRAWFMMRTDLLLIFCIGFVIIYFVAAKSAGQLISRLHESDEQREQALLQMEHSQKLSSIGRLAAGVAHEINNPLAVINEKAGLLRDLLEMEADFPNKQQFDDQLKSISSTVARCRDITHRMLGFARRMDVKIEELDVNGVIEETMLFFEKEARNRNIVMTKDLLEDLPKVPCDRGQLQQVVLNVLNNGLAAVEDGGLISISTARRGADAVIIRVTDNGSGMSEETKRHIFEPFFTTKKEKGTGLGMSIIYGIVKRHGGDIEVESELNKGTTVAIILPLERPGPGQPVA